MSTTNKKWWNMELEDWLYTSSAGRVIGGVLTFILCFLLGVVGVVIFCVISGIEIRELASYKWYVRSICLLFALAGTVLYLYWHRYVLKMLLFPVRVVLEFLDF